MPPPSGTATRSCGSNRIRTTTARHTRRAFLTRDTTMHWKYLLFDLDGTLTDPMQGITRSVQYALRHFGIEVEDLAALCPFIGPPLRDSFREYYGMSAARADEAAEKYGEYFSRQGIYENRLYPEIPELLADLQARGAALVMATSKPAHLAERIARHFGFADRFSLICGGTAYGPCSTKAGVIRDALDRLSVTDPRQAVMIGDRRFDIEGAAEAGIASIGVLWGYGSRDELTAAAPDLLAADISELGRMLSE